MDSLGVCPDKPFPDASTGICCIGSAVYGAARCTCWEPVYDVEQVELVVGPSSFRDEMCVDRAYRPGSPERRGDPTVNGSDEALRCLAAAGEPFFCHQGIRRPLRWEHRPEDATVEQCEEACRAAGFDRVGVWPGSPANYCPPIVAGVPYRADGTPAQLCAGWAKRASTDHIDDRVLAAMRPMTAPRVKVPHLCEEVDLTEHMVSNHKRRRRG